MKKYKLNVAILFLAALMMCTLLPAQDHKEEISVDLTNPSQSGTLDVRSHNGTITIEGYSGNEVLVEIYTPENDDDDDEHQGNKHGLKKISMKSMNVDIYEEENYVKIEGGQKRTDFVIKVPRKFDLAIKAHHNGTVEVSNVEGQMEIISHHGAIRLEDVAGSLVADTHHGEITANFLSITDKPMAFSTYHGDVDIAFPPGTNFDAKIKSERGDIYTDFEVSMNPVNKESRKNKSGKKQIKIGGWMTGKFGSGGKEYLFNTYHGDVIIRKS